MDASFCELSDGVAVIAFARDERETADAMQISDGEFESIRILLIGIGNESLNWYIDQRIVFMVQDGCDECSQIRLSPYRCGRGRVLVPEVAEYALDDDLALVDQIGE